MYYLGDTWPLWTVCFNNYVNTVLSSKREEKALLGKREDDSVQAGRAQALLARGCLRRAAEVLFTS